jgi:hypothetical protein
VHGNWQLALAQWRKFMTSAAQATNEAERQSVHEGAMQLGDQAFYALESGDAHAAEQLCIEAIRQDVSNENLKQLLMQIQYVMHTNAASEYFPGTQYLEWLRWFQATLKPATYLEIGVESGNSLQFAKSPTKAVGVDPAIQVVHPQETWSKLFKLPSDAFFSMHDLRQVIDAETLDLAFIDGLHEFDQALKDFINVERYAGPNTVVLFHDIYPVTPITAARDRVTKFWPGDTWKVMMILKETRPDLNIFTIPTYPSGLGVVTRLNPDSTALSDEFKRIVDEWMPVHLEPYMPKITEHLNVVRNDFVTVSRLIKAK